MDLEASLRLFPSAYECGAVEATISHIWIDIKHRKVGKSRRGNVYKSIECHIHTRQTSFAACELLGSFEKGT
jgi:hypothetical protein